MTKRINEPLPIYYADETGLAFIRKSDLPDDLKEEFRKWLVGQTIPMPMLDGELVEDAVYPWDFDRWNNGRPIID